MKKLFVLLAVFTFSLGVSAQEATSSNPKTEAPKPQLHHLIMQNGKMMKVMTDGKTSALTGTTTLNNGVEVTTNGIVTLQNSETMRVYNGDQIDKDGKITKMPKKKK